MPDNDPPHRQQNLSIRSLGREPKSWPQGTAKNAAQQNSAKARLELPADLEDCNQLILMLKVG